MCSDSQKPPPDAPLAALRTALARMDRMDLPPDARAALDEALAALDDSAPSPPPGVVDREVFDGLLSMAGPVVARELLVQLVVDLETVQRALAQALPAQDWTAMRGQTHVLMSLAGAAGARTLEVSAQALNRAAHHRDAQAVQHWGGRVLAGVTQLTAFVREAAPSRPAAPGGRT